MCTPCFIPLPVLKQTIIYLIWAEIYFMTYRTGDLGAIKICQTIQTCHFLSAFFRRQGFLNYPDMSSRWLLGPVSGEQICLPLSRALPDWGLGGWAWALMKIAPDRTSQSNIKCDQLSWLVLPWAVEAPVNAGGEAVRSSIRSGPGLAWWLHLEVNITSGRRRGVWRRHNKGRAPMWCSNLALHLKPE